METLLVLGIIPGTGFQIDFGDWLAGMIILAGLTACAWLYLNRFRIELVFFFVTMRWRVPAGTMPRQA